MYHRRQLSAREGGTWRDEQGLPPKKKVKEGRLGIVSHSTVYCPFQLFLAPSCLLMISAISVGRTMRDVPTSTTPHQFAVPVREGEGRTSVDGSARGLELESLLAEHDLLNCDLPVSLPPEGNVLDLALVVGRVDSSEGCDTLLRVGSEPEGEDGGVEEALLDHVVEGGDDVLDGDVVVGESEDSVCISPSSSAHSKGVDEQAEDSPNLPNAKASPGSTVDSAKSWFLISRSPMLRTSLEMIPSREPLPYWILNSVPLAT